MNSSRISKLMEDRDTFDHLAVFPRVFFLATAHKSLACFGADS